VGYATRKIEIHLTLDDHGDEREERDQKLFEEIADKIDTMLDQPEYEHLRGMVMTF
jgi:hypothetical protein